MGARTGFAALAAFLCVTIAVSAIPLQEAGGALPSSGIIIPLYTAPGSTWNAVIQAKLANPSLAFIVIVNPASGPGTTSQQSFAQGVQSLQSAGIIVLGYVYTNYGLRTISSVESDVTAYKNWYNVNGILFDEMPNVPGFEAYYTTLNTYTKSLGMEYTAGNPGTPLPSSYLGILDLYVVDEGTSPPASSVPGINTSSMASVLYSVPTLTQAYVTALTQVAGYIYVTNQALPNPYDALPAYFTNLVSYLALSLPDSQSNSTTSSQTVSSTTTAVSTSSATSTAPASVFTIQTEAVNGTAIPGLWAAIQSDSGMVASGFTPLSFTATPGATYLVSAANYGNYVLDHWSNNATTNTISWTPSGSTLTAYYRYGRSVTLSVQAAGPGGIPISGMWAAVMSQGVTVYSGFTPLVWQVVAGTSYEVVVANYGGYRFTNWAGGNASNPLSITPPSNLALTATYAVPTTPTSTSQTSSTTSSAAAKTTYSASTAYSSTASPTYTNQSPTVQGVQSATTQTVTSTVTSPAGPPKTVTVTLIPTVEPSTQTVTTTYMSITTSTTLVTASGGAAGSAEGGQKRPNTRLSGAAALLAAAAPGAVVAVVIFVRPIQERVTRAWSRLSGTEHRDSEQSLEKKNRQK